MKLYELATGIIAAVLIALGAYQYVNRTTVEEEPVVEHMETMQPERWYFDPSLGSNPDNPANYVPYNSAIHGTLCDGNSQMLCSIEAFEDGSTNKPLLDPEIEVTIDEPFYSPTTRVE